MSLNKRRFAIADIHGCARTLAALLAQIDLQRDDTLFLLGDYIDRGPDSKGVLDQLLALQADGFDLWPLRGNHEQMLLDALDDNTVLPFWKMNGGGATLYNFGVKHPKELPSRYLDFIASLPLLHLLDDYVLVHAGLDFRTPAPITDSSPRALLWTRDFRIDPAKLAGRTLVTGHNTVALFVIEAALTSCHIPLDNCCFSRGEINYGALLALDLNQRQLLVMPNTED